MPNIAGTSATAQFFAGTKDGQPAFLDYGTGETNILPARREVIRLTDIRRLLQPPTIQSNGFQKVDAVSPSLRHNFLAPRSDVIDSYYRECEKLVEDIVGASRVIAFHHRCRQQDPCTTDKVKNYVCTPVPDFHIDNDSTTAHVHLARTVGTKQAANWTSRHWAIVNVWRPLGEPVRRMPLAVLDPTSIQQEKGMAEPIYTRSNYKTHIRGLKYQPEYRFLYVSEMKPEEALLFVDFDSEEKWKLGGVAHAAVEESGVRNDAPLRRSIEVRCLVLY